MSKSDPNSAIFLTDNLKDLKRKINKSFCPERIIENNPVLDIYKHIIFPYYFEEILISRPEKYGGDITFKNYNDLEQNFMDGNIDPVDLKRFLLQVMIDIIIPISDNLKVI